MISDGANGLSDDQWIDWTLESAQAIAEAAGAGSARPVPSCDWWTMTDLVEHIGRLLNGWYPHNLTREPGDHDSLRAKQSAPPVPEDHRGRIDYLLSGAKRYADVARRTDRDASVWTIGITGPARFWVVRAACETAIHRYDAEHAVESVEPMSPTRGAASVDEMLRGLWMRYIWSSEHPNDRDLRALERKRTTPMILPAFPRTPIGIRASDSGATWLVQQCFGRLEVVPDTDLPMTTITGTGFELSLWLHGRRETRSFSVTGSIELLDAWNLGVHANP